MTDSMERAADAERLDAHRYWIKKRGYIWPYEDFAWFIGVIEARGGTAMKPMVPTAEERYQGALIHSAKSPYTLSETMACAFDITYRDGHAAGFAEALEMLREPSVDLTHAVHRLLREQFLNAASPHIDTILRATNDAIRSLATAPTGEKKTADNWLNLPHER